MRPVSSTDPLHRLAMSALLFGSLLLAACSGGGGGSPTDGDGAGGDGGDPPPDGSGGGGGDPGDGLVIERVSIAPDGSQADDSCWGPQMTDDGGLVAFVTFATALHPITIGPRRVLVADRATGSLGRADLTATGVPSDGVITGYDLGISGDGRYLAFATTDDGLASGDSNGARDIFIKRWQDGESGELVHLTSGADHSSGGPRLTADGDQLVFWSRAENLVAGDDNGVTDIFVAWRPTGGIDRVNISDLLDGQADAESTSPDISGNGNRVVFASEAGNLVTDSVLGNKQIYLRDRFHDRTLLVSRDRDGEIPDGASTQPAISGDGRHIAYVSLDDLLVVGDGNGVQDIFVTTFSDAMVRGATVRVSVASDGSEADAVSRNPAISADGRYVAFVSDATNLVADDGNGTADVFHHDTQTGVTRRVSAPASGGDGDGTVGDLVAISADGLTVSFSSTSSNLVAGDDNAQEDVFTVVLPPVGGG